MSLVFALIEELLFALITPVFGLPWFPRNFAATFRAVLPIDFHLNVVIYWLIVGFSMASATTVSLWNVNDCPHDSSCAQPNSRINSHKQS